MAKKRPSRDALAVRMRGLAKMAAPTAGPNAVAIHPNWKARLKIALDGIPAFAQIRRASHLTTRGDSADGRAFLELIERDGKLLQGDLQLAFPDSQDLVSIKLECWALLFLKALFAEWAEVGEWLREATRCAVRTEKPVAKWLNGHCVLCRYDPNANVLDLRVVMY